MSDSQHMAEACAIADAYNAHLQQIGLPTYGGWKNLTCDQKIIALSSVFSGGIVTGALDAAAFVVGLVHADSELHWLRDRAREATSWIRL